MKVVKKTKNRHPVSMKDQYYYGTVTINLRLKLTKEQVRKASGPHDKFIDYLETNMKEQVQAVINYAKTQITLEHDLAVESGDWSWT